MVRLIEYLRIVWMAAGLWLAYAYTTSASYYLLIGIVLPLTGLSAIQGVFFHQASADYMDRKISRYSHLQGSGFFVGVCLTSIGALLLHAGSFVQLTLVLLTLLCFLLSGLVHLYQFIKEQGAPRVHLWRFIGVVLLCLFSLYPLCIQFCSH